MSIKRIFCSVLFSVFVALPSAFALDAVTVAESLLTVNSGSKYIDGGNGPLINDDKRLVGTTGFDCSGLTWYAFGHLGIEIELDSATQATMAKGSLLTKPKVSDLRRGDLLFFDTRDTYVGTINHVGIYEGGGKFLQASSKGIDLVSTDFDTGWISYVLGIRWTDRLLSARRLPSYTGTPSSWFKIGDKVEATFDGVEVWKLRQKVLLTDSRKMGDRGTVKFGPVLQTVGRYIPYWYWLVDFDTGVDGWVAEDALRKVGSGGEVVINFDDLTSPEPWFMLPTGYRGLSWSPEWFVVTDAFYRSDYGNTYGSPSGENAASNGFGVLVVTAEGGGTFDFLGAYFAGWSFGDGPSSQTASAITVEGYTNGRLVGSKTMALSGTGYQWMEANIAGVDELRFVSSQQGQWWLVDDIKLRMDPN